MIEAVVLTLRHKERVKRQNTSEQDARTKSTAMDGVRAYCGSHTIPDIAAAKGAW